MQSFFAELDLQFELLGFSCESRFVFGVDDLICPLLIGSQLITSATGVGMTERTWRNLPSLCGLVVRYRVEMYATVLTHSLCGHD